MEQEDKDLSYLVLANDQDDAFDSVDTETLLVEMNEGSHNKNDESLEVDTDVVQLFGDPNLPAVEKAQLLSRSVFDFHRSFLAREVSTILPEMNIYDAIAYVIPIIHEFSSDSMESVRESLASQLDKIVIYFFQNALVVDYGSRSEQQSQQDTNDTPSLSHPPSIPHNTFTPIFINLLLDQNSGIAHQTRLAVVSVAESISEKLLETEIMDGVIAGLERLYNVEVVADGDSQDSQEDMSDQDNEAELGKMLVVVLLTSLANALGKHHCSTIVLPKLEKLAKQSEFYVRKEIVMALGTLCKVVDQDVVISRLLPLYDSFIQDDTWHIRRACCTVLASFVSSLPVEMKINKVEQIYDLYSADVSRSVRSSIMEVLGEVIAGFEKEKVPESLLNYFLSMGQSPMNEHDLAAMCAFSFPAVILTAGRSKWEQMKPVYMRLAGTFRSPIRRSLACSLHEVARILGPEIADRDLTIPFSDCLMAEDEVKEGVIGHVVEFISCLSPKCRSEALRDLFNAWTDLERSSNWRLRDSLAGQLPGLCEIAEGDNLLEYLMPLSVRACTDGVSTIRESGVMAFPALWEASERIGPFVHKKSARIAKSVEDDVENGTLGSFSEGEDVDMEDVTEQLYEPSDRVQESKSENSANGSASSPSSSPPTVHKSEHEDEDEEHPTMTTIRDEVIRQTAHFATNGGFRSRVVAVQIIQSLLDHGIYVEEFEQHFLSLLADQLATDPVVNVRIWVSRVVSWIIESGYYNDVPVSSRLQDLLTTLQKDSDRDVRIYAGGPAELPKLKKKKRKSSKDKKKKKKSKNEQTLGGTFRQGSSDQVSTINEEDEDAEDVQLLRGDGDSDDVEDDDDDDEDEDDDDEDDSEDDSDEDDSDDSMEFLNSAKTKGISNKPRNRNSIGIGMKVMVGNKLTVSGKEIRKPKTSWDYVHGEIDEDEEELGDNSRKSFLASLGSKDGKTHHWNPDGDHDDEDEGESLFDAPRQPLEHDDEDAEDAEAEDGVENSTPSQDISKVIPYTANSASGASPLDVEMEDAVQDGSGERVAVVVSGGDEEAALAGQEQQVSANDKEKKTDDEPSAAGPPKDASSPSPSPAGSPAVLKQEILAKNPETGRGVGGAVTVNAAASPVRNRNGILVNKELTSASSPEEKVLRALNAKLGASKKHPPISITVPPVNKKSMLAFKDPGSPSYAAIVASGASSPRPTGPIVPGLGLGSVKGSVSPFSPPLSPMPNASSSFRLQP
ncbi:Serine/threonine-protein phosphatase 4 regulatory subunit 1 [Mortierella polycephala]|uniref:Serine/threonine-protein phosphatase 4 regulatory subunit 1 n=1 Tax=Mortierella polycephala TaxID=41804 RepID=A0A9P6Q4S7_9FUNG|nr:Serine/threonine-protein phosphatase 4 regulatory subunit 1 [Mortierella polycephala]